ncbi:MAG: DUF932 domain-containing protein [Nitrospiraceae bacterium]
MDNIATDSRSGQKMAFTAETPAWWDTLGACVREAQTWENVLETAHLDWSVTKAPLYTQWSKSGLFQVDSHVAIVRTDTKQHLGVVGSGYEPVQNAQALKWTEALMGSGAKYESAGGLGQGERIWLLARVPAADFTIGAGDKHEGYLLVTTSHDGSMATVAKHTLTRVVCQNTLNAALSEKSLTIRIKHTRSAPERMLLAKQLISGSIVGAQKMKERLQALADFKVQRVHVEAILDKLFPVDKEASKAAKTRRENVIGEILGLYAGNDGNMFPEQAGTGFAMLNAVTNYTDHFRMTRVKSGSTTTDTQSRAESAIWGSGSAFKDSALAVIESVCSNDLDDPSKMWNELTDLHGKGNID